MTPIDIEQLKDKLGFGADKVYAVMGEFSDPHDLVRAGRKIREMGYTKIDAMSPFPVHGIDDAIGVPYSKLGWIVISIAVCGSATAWIAQRASAPRRQPRIRSSTSASTS